MTTARPTTVCQNCGEPFLFAVPERGHIPCRWCGHEELRSYDEKVARRESGLWGAALLIVVIWIGLIGLALGAIWLITRI